MWGTDTDINAFNDILRTKPEISLKKEIVNGKIEVGIISYNMEKSNTFDTDLARECRGITFRLDTGDLISRPFHKFFNINEKPFTQAAKIDWQNIIYISEKIDGVLAVPVLIDGEILWKTKKSFYSPQAAEIQRFYDTQATPWFKNEIKDYLERGITPIFEWVNPSSPIVIQYNEPNLVLLNTRDNITGKYFFPENSVDLYKDKFQDYKEFLSYVEKLENIEGVVIHDGKDFYKIKTKWYLERHKAVSKLSVKSIIQMYIDGTIDDVISELYTYNYVDRARLLEKYRDEFTSYILNEKEIATLKLEECKRQFKRTELRTQIIHDVEHSAIMFQLLDNKDVDVLLKKRMKFFFSNKYKNILHFMGDINFSDKEEVKSI